MPHRNFMMKNGLLRSWGERKLSRLFLRKKPNQPSFVFYEQPILCVRGSVKNEAVIWLRRASYDRCRLGYYWDTACSLALAKNELQNFDIMRRQAIKEHLQETSRFWRTLHSFWGDHRVNGRTTWSIRHIINGMFLDVFMFNPLLRVQSP